MKTIITNTPVNRHVTNAAIEQWFSDNSIEITGKSLSIKRDEDGRIMKVEVDADMTDLQAYLFKVQFFYIESTLEEIGRVELSENVHTFNVDLTKNKNYIQMNIHTHIDGVLTKNYRMYFTNLSPSPRAYSINNFGLGAALNFPLVTRDHYGLLSVSNLQTQIKQGVYNVSGYNRDTSFKWNNTTDYISTFRFRLNAQSYFKAGTTVVVHGWD